MGCTFWFHSMVDNWQKRRIQISRLDMNALAYPHNGAREPISAIHAFTNIHFCLYEEDHGMEIDTTSFCNYLYSYFDNN